MLNNIQKFFWNHRIHLFFTLSIASVILLLGLLLFVFKFNNQLEALELKLFDFRTMINLRTRAVPPDPDIIMLICSSDSLIELDEYPQLNLGRWPWGRDVWVDMLNYLKRAPNKVTAFDIFFASEDKFNPTADKQLLYTLNKNDNTILAFVHSDTLNNIYSGLLNFTLINSSDNNKTDSDNDEKNKDKSNKNNNPKDKKESSTKSNPQKSTPLKKLTLENFNKLITVIIANSHKYNVNKYDKEKVILNKLVPLTKTDMLNFGIKSLIYSTFFQLENTSLRYLRASKSLGNAGVQKLSTADEIVRENKPLWRVSITNRFAMSLPLATARLALEGSKEANIKIKKGFFGPCLKIGDRELALNSIGNLYINWRSNKNLNSSSDNLESFTTISAVRALAYERFETMDMDKGYYTHPDDYEVFNNSHYMKMLISPLEDIYYQMLTTNYSLFWSDVEGDPFNETSLRDSLNTDIRMPDDTKEVPDDVARKQMFYEPATFTNKVIKTTEESDFYSFINYINNLNYVDRYVNSNYFNFGKYFFTNNNNQSYIYDNYFYNRCYNYSIIPEVENIPLTDLLPFNNLYSQTDIYEYSTPEKDELSDNKKSSNKIIAKYAGSVTIPYENITFNGLDSIAKLALDPEVFINKIIILGQAYSGGDLHAIPNDNAFPGPEIVATAMDNYLNDGTSDSRSLAEAPLWLNIIVMILSVIITFYLTMKTTNYIFGIIALILILMIYTLLNTFMFAMPDIKIWINMVYPMILIVLTSMGTLMYKNMVIDKDKRQIKALFGKFVSPQILEAVLNDPKLLSAQQARKRNMTVLFSDIRDFTSKSEQMNPDLLINQLNEYLSEMVEVIILEYNGTLDKYMGDAIMAFWGDPVPMEDHAKRAVLTALSMRQHLKLLNERWAQQGKQEFRIGIGVNSGEMIVGHMGSPRLVDYTVLGDNVNVASRIEGLNKQFGTEIIISRSTLEYVKDIVNVKELGKISVKGREEQVEIFEVEGLKEDAKVEFNKEPLLYTGND